MTTVSTDHQGGKLHLDFFVWRHKTGNSLQYQSTLRRHSLETVSVFKMSWCSFWFDKPLTWSHHITHLYNTCNKINLLKCISKTKWGVDESTMSLLCKTDVTLRFYRKNINRHRNFLNGIIMLQTAEKNKKLTATKIKFLKTYSSVLNIKKISGFVSVAENKYLILQNPTTPPE